MKNLIKLRNFYYYIAMTISKIRNFFESLQSVKEDYMNEIIIHVSITYVFLVVVLMIIDIRAFETKTLVSYFGTNNLLELPLI